MFYDPSGTQRNATQRNATQRNASLWLLVGLFLLILPACSKQELNPPIIQGVQKVPSSHSDGALAPEESHSISNTNYTYYSVTRVVDGDTIVLSDKTKVRYIGIDTPETKHPKKSVQFFGKEASEANKKLVEGKKIRLEYDVQKTDKYKRTLAYVYLDDGTFVNAWLVENGYAHVSTYPPNVKYQSKLIELERKAREGKRGLWQ